jgi:hypothetical protein
MSRRTCKAALDAHLLAFSAKGMGDIAWEGVPYQPNEGRGYIAARMPAYARQPLGVGADCVVQESGTYQITVNRPTTEGDDFAGSLAERLVAWFARGTILVAGTGQSLVIENASEMPAQPTGNWLSVPVVVSWICSIP